MHDLAIHQDFDHRTFYDAFLCDVRSARALLVIQSPFLSLRQINCYLKEFKGALSRGVRVCVFAQQPRDWSGADSDFALRHSATDVAAQTLASVGVHVTLRPKIHEKMVLVDEDILWDGSLNILSHFDTTERMTRWVGREKVVAALAKHRLNSCAACADRYPLGLWSFERVPFSAQLALLGERIAMRRIEFGWSQSELAARARVQQHVVSEIESGTRNVKMATLMKLLTPLRLSLIPSPWHYIPRLSECLIDEEMVTTSTDTRTFSPPLYR